MARQSAINSSDENGTRTSRAASRQKSSSVIKTAEKKAKATARTAASKVGKVANEQIAAAANTVSSEAGTFGDTLAKALRVGAKELSGAGYARTANIAYQAGDLVSEFSDKAVAVDGENIADRAKKIASERPALVYGGLALAGFLGALALSRTQKK